MKKAVLIILFLLSYNFAFAQYKGQIRVIHGYEVPSDTGFFGMSFGGEYISVNRLSIAPSVTFFLPATGNARGFDINARYYFTEESVQWYGLLGYGKYVRVFEFNPIGRKSFDSINIGTGAMIKLRDEIGLNPEIRFQPYGRNEFIFKLGVVYFVN
jgi:hypothetical protein